MQVTAQALIGTWVWCAAAPPNDSNICSSASTIIFQADGNRSNGLAQHTLPNCEGDPFAEFIDPPSAYVVNGTATTSEGLNAFEVVYSDDTTYYHIDGNTLYIAEELPEEGIVTAFTAPYARQ